MKELRNDQLVQRITEVGSPFMVKVDIVRNEEGEFKWSSQSDGERELQVGMVGEGSIILMGKVDLASFAANPMTCFRS